MTREAHTPSFRTARRDEAEAIAALVNSAYRGDESRRGWTTEADLLEGRRIDRAGIEELIDATDSVVLLCLGGEEIVGSVHLERTGTSAYLGLLVVRPGLQGAGIGKKLLSAAEEFVRREWAARKMWMTVITLRDELIAFYGRRGYARTGRVKPLPLESGLSVALIDGLELEVLEKAL